jgi:dimethylglycine dehydrogenase
MAGVYDALWKAGSEFDIRDFGMYAMDSLRLEKCYRGWKSDLTHEYTPLMASLDRLIAFDKPDFIGRAALLEERETGPKERLVPLVFDEAGAADAPYCSPVLHDETIVGLTVSSGFGHALGKVIALAYVRSDLATPGQRLEVRILGDRASARVGIEPLYDRDNARMRM